MRARFLGLVLAMVAALPASAAPPAVEDPEATVVQELVVRAAVSGPAWWTVEKGGSVVHVLGLPDEPFPKGQRWDQAGLKRRLEGASVLIVPVVATAGLGDIPTFFRWRSRLKSKTPLEQALPAPLAARFAAARMRFGKPASRYASWDPIVAGSVLMNDFYDAARTARNEPLSAIKGLARRQGVPVRPAAKFRVVALLDPAIRNLTPEISQACLGEALDEVDAGSGVLTGAGGAWAKGDVAGVLAGPRGFASCLLLIQGGAVFWRQTMAEAADAVAAALQKPGHSVAVFQMRSLLAKDGVLERLKARGFKVSGGGN